MKKITIAVVAIVVLTLACGQGGGGEKGNGAGPTPTPVPGVAEGVKDALGIAKAISSGFRALLALDDCVQGQMGDNRFCPQK